MELEVSVTSGDVLWPVSVTSTPLPTAVGMYSEWCVVCASTIRFRTVHGICSRFQPAAIDTTILPGSASSFAIGPMTLSIWYGFSAMTVASAAAMQRQPAHWRNSSSRSSLSPMAAAPRPRCHRRCGVDHAQAMAWAHITVSDESDGLDWSTTLSFVVDSCRSPRFRGPR